MRVALHVAPQVDCVRNDQYSDDRRWIYFRVGCSVRSGNLWEAFASAFVSDRELLPKLLQSPVTSSIATTPKPNAYQTLELMTTLRCGNYFENDQYKSPFQSCDGFFRLHEEEKVTDVLQHCPGPPKGPFAIKASNGGSRPGYQALVSANFEEHIGHQPV
jgi:hypothetical protein